MRPASTATRARLASSAGGHVRLGSAWRLSEVQAAVVLVHLQRLDEFIGVRRSVAARYDEALPTVPGLAPLTEPPGSVSNYYKYVALLDPGLDRSVLKSGAARRLRRLLERRGLRHPAASRAGVRRVRRRPRYPTPMTCAPGRSACPSIPT